MTNSIDNSPSAQRSKEARLAKLRSGEIETTRPEDKEDPSELPRWVKTALVMRLVESMTWDEAAGEFGKAGSSLKKYGSSLAAKKWLEGLNEFMEDPIQVAKAILAGNALNITLDRFVLYEKAKHLDIALADKIAKDLQSLGGIVAPKQDTGAIVVKVQVAGGGAVEIPAIEADWELVEPKKLPKPEAD